MTNEAVNKVAEKVVERIFESSQSGYTKGVIPDLKHRTLVAIENLLRLMDYEELEEVERQVENGA